MEFPAALVAGRFLRREKRFFIHARLDDGREVVAAGDRAVLVFCCQRGDAVTVGSADDIDPVYGRLLRQVAAAGVEILGLGARVEPAAITPERLLTVELAPFPA